jgi:hypothetical protein
MIETCVESAGSKMFRRIAGAVGIAGLVVTLVAGAIGARPIATYAFVIFLAVPWLAFIGHLNLTKCLTRTEKGVWKREFSWRHRWRSTIALWAYLFADDVRTRTKGFAPYRSESNVG